MKLYSAVVVLVAAMLVAITQAVPQAKSAVDVSAARSAPQLLLARDSSSGTCACACMSAKAFALAAPCKGDSCEPLDCSLGKDADGKKISGKTCCMISDTIDPYSTNAVPSSARATIAEAPATAVADLPDSDSDDPPSSSDSELSPSSRGYRRYRCYYWYRTRCYCYNYRLGYRVYRRCRCFRFRYRRCRWVYY